jgi:hypothetical protein
MQRAYPDISTILAAKVRRRSRLAALSWEEKVAIVERMRALWPRDPWGARSADKDDLDQSGVAENLGAVDSQ